MTTQLETARILATLAAAYPRYTLTPDTTEVYHRLLSDLEVGLLEAAAIQCATHQDFFPSVAELRQAAAELHCRALKIPTAFEAWGEVRRAGRGWICETREEDGQFVIIKRKFEFSHPIAERVALQLGWPDEFPGDNPGVDRAHFFKAYESELNSYLSERTTLPAVRTFIEGQQAKLLEITTWTK